MLFYLAQTDPDKALAEGYLLLFFVALIGLFGVLLMVGLFVLRRSTRRRLDLIEQDKHERRAARSVGRVDAWQAGSDRYIDHDKLPESEPGLEDAAPWSEEDYRTDPNEDNEPDDPPPGWDEPEHGDQDPFGLFEDKPYREPDDDDDLDDDQDEDDEDWDEDQPHR